MSNIIRVMIIVVLYACSICSYLIMNYKYICVNEFPNIHNSIWHMYTDIYCFIVIFFKVRSKNVFMDGILVLVNILSSMYTSSEL